jgi:hypothetical protein
MMVAAHGAVVSHLVLDCGKARADGKSTEPGENS